MYYKNGKQKKRISFQKSKEGKKTLINHKLIRSMFERRKL